jgi:hypothetical protein
MGERAMPLILEDMKARGGDWYLALDAILEGNHLDSESPVPDDADGNVRRIKQAWFDWGKRKGYLSV